MKILEMQSPIKFTQPFRQIMLMLWLVLLFSIGVYFVYPSVAAIFLASPYLNGIIVIVFFIGLISCFWHVAMMISAVNWIEDFALGRPGQELTKAPRLLGSLAALLSNRTTKFVLTSTSMRSILDSVAIRLDEGRDITRYIVNLLIFLGLLGTFYGLATTVPAVVDTIRSLVPDDGSNPLDIFDNLMSGLEKQLGGMGTAFGSSLLGLAGSLVVGLLDLFAGHTQSRFYRELEEWLSSMTKIGTASADKDDDKIVSIPHIVDKTSAQIENLQTILVQNATQLDQILHSIKDLVQQTHETYSSNQNILEGLLQQTSETYYSNQNVLERLVKHANETHYSNQDVLQHLLQHASETDRNNQNALHEIAHGQGQIVDAIARMQSEGEGILDAETRMRLRSMDGSLTRILEDMTVGRIQSLSELRRDAGLLLQSIDNLAHNRR